MAFYLIFCWLYLLVSLFIMMDYVDFKLYLKFFPITIVWLVYIVSQSLIFSKECFKPSLKIEQGCFIAIT